MKRQNVSRSLSFGPTMTNDARQEDDNSSSRQALETDQHGHLQEQESKGTLRLSTKQVKKHLFLWLRFSFLGYVCHFYCHCYF